MCVYVCTPFFSHFEADRDIIWHKVAFSLREGPFSILLNDFAVHLKSDYRQVKGGPNVILFGDKLTGHRRKLGGKLSTQKLPDLLLCQFVLNRGLELNHYIYESISTDLGLLLSCANYVILSNFYL